MGLILKILLNPRFIRFNLLLFLIWLFTGHDFTGKILGLISLVYAVFYFTNPEPFVAGIRNETSQRFLRRFGGVILIIWGILLFINIHTQNTVTEGIFLLLILVPFIILALSDNFYKIGATFKKKFITISLIGAFILAALFMILQPTPSQLNFIDIIIILGLVVDIIRNKGNEEQNHI